MPQIQPIDRTQPGAAADIIEGVRAKLGVVPNIFATMARSPAVLEGYLAFSDALGTGALNAAVREQIALAIAGANQCDYCASAHTLLAKGAGVAETEAHRNLRGEASNPKVAAIIAFARDVVETRGRVSEASLDQLRDAGVSDTEIVEVLAHIGLNLFTNYFNHVANTEIDFPVGKNVFVRPVSVIDLFVGNWCVFVIVLC